MNKPNELAWRRLRARIRHVTALCALPEINHALYSFSFDGPLGTPYSSHRRCRTCGCTDTHACFDHRGPCWWAELDVCSHCADPHTNPCPPGDLKPDGYQVNEVS